MYPPSPKRVKSEAEDRRLKKIEKLAIKLLLTKNLFHYENIETSVKQAERLYNEIDKLKTT